MSQKQTAKSAFITKKARINNALNRLQQWSQNHFHMDSNTIHWGHVGDLERIEALLTEATDIVFSEGEYEK